MTSISLTWERVDCLLRHGEIQSYTVTTNSRYSSGSSSVADRMITFNNLIPFTVYNITIAAVGANGMAGPTLNVDVETEPVEGM
jgi:hypothetical protein